MGAEMPVGDGRAPQLLIRALRDPDGANLDRIQVVKGTLNADLTDDVFQKITLKLTYSGEVSNETYLGLSDADFRANPNRRYASTALGRAGSVCQRKDGRARRSAACIAATLAGGMARSLRSSPRGSARASRSATRTVNSS